MSKAGSSGGAAVFPAGFVLRIEADGAVIGNGGDVVIETDLASSLGPIKKVYSERGSVRLSAPEMSVEQVTADGGEVHISGAVRAQHVRGRAVKFTDGALKARVVQASEEASLLGASIEAEVVVAPRVVFGPATSGRATAVGATNDLGPHKVRGCFSLTEYVDLFPNGRQTLESFGVSPTDPAAGSMAADGGQPDWGNRAPAPAKADEEEEEDEGDPAASSAAPAGGAAADGPSGVESQVGEALRRIIDCYARDDVPPPIGFLDSLVAESRFDEIRLQLNGIWRDLLKYHQKKGLRISNTVTQQFQAIQLLMKRVVA